MSFFWFDTGSIITEISTGIPVYAESQTSASAIAAGDLEGRGRFQSLISLVSQTFSQLKAVGKLQSLTNCISQTTSEIKGVVLAESLSQSSAVSNSTIKAGKFLSSSVLVNSSASSHLSARLFASSAVINFTEISGKLQAVGRVVASTGSVTSTQTILKAIAKVSSVGSGSTTFISKIAGKINLLSNVSSNSSSQSTLKSFGLLQSSTSASSFAAGVLSQLPRSIVSSALAGAFAYGNLRARGSLEASRAGFSTAQGSLKGYSQAIGAAVGSAESTGTIKAFAKVISFEQSLSSGFSKLQGILSLHARSDADAASQTVIVGYYSIASSIHCQSLQSSKLNGKCTTSCSLSSFSSAQGNLQGRANLQSTQSSDAVAVAQLELKEARSSLFAKIVSSSLSGSTLKAVTRLRSSAFGVSYTSSEFSKYVRNKIFYCHIERQNTRFKVESKSRLMEINKESRLVKVMKNDRETVVKRQQRVLQK